MEPYRLREWRVTVGRLFTCARPGRSKWKDAPQVPKKIIDQWVHNLPSKEIEIVSLLGQKPDGTSEYSFYLFRGGFDPNDGEKPLFQEWLALHYPDRRIKVHEHPTIDFSPIQREELENIAITINLMLQAGKTVLLIDSGGQTRTGTVCRYLKLQEKFG